MKFRQDINGLRAIAVIAVVLFHFNASWMPGGFAGVDVFFVISGFLMTGIIFRDIDQQRFSLSRFYVARANRIIPALALLCTVLLIFGWFFLTPPEYRRLAKHAATSIGFVSNFIYGTETGYFDVASHEKWLLHSWSLSVEWQFYIVYPLILVALNKLVSLKAMRIIVLLSTVFGFLFSAIATYQWPVLSYYYLPTRAWEMMLGGVAYLYPFTLKPQQKRALEWLGLFLIIGSYFLISAANPWPGYLAAFPVVGAFLVIQAQRDTSVFTSNIIFQKLGAWSYSIYLWHWPLVVAIYYFSLSEAYIYLGMALSVVLGFLSYKYVENIRFKKALTNRSSYFYNKPLLMAVVIIVIGGTLYAKSDEITPHRLTTDQISIINQQQEDPREAVCGKVENGHSPACIYGEGEIKAIVIGDSHAQAQNVAIGDRAALHGGSIVSFGMAACPTIKGVFKVDDNGKNPDYNCGQLVANVITTVATQYPDIPVIIINRVSEYLNGPNEETTTFSLSPNKFIDKIFMDITDDYKENITGHMVDTICEFAKNHPVYLLKPTPEMKKDVPITMFRSILLKSANSNIKMPVDEYDQRHQDAFRMQNEAAEQCGAKILDPLPYLCDKQWCYGDIDKVPLYLDDDHLSLYGSKVIAPVYDEVLISN